MPLDPAGMFWLLHLLYNNFNITDLSVGELLGIGNSSVVKVYVDENDFSWVKTEWITNYTGSGKQLISKLVWMPNETYPYMCFNFPLSQGKVFGNYTGALNISLGGEFSYYNGSWYNSTPISIYGVVSFPGTYLFYPAFNVTGTETVTVTAGKYECWKMKILNPTNPDDKIGDLWYSPDAKNIVKLNTFMTVGDCQYNLYVELEGYSGQVSPAPPGVVPYLLSQLMVSYLLVSSLYQAQQQRNMILLGVAVIVVAGVAVAIFATRRRRT